jgi:hypothetical protein
MIEGKAVFYIPLWENKDPKIDNGAALLYAKGFDSEDEIMSAITKSGKGIVTSIEELDEAGSFDIYSIHWDYSGYLLKLQSGDVRFIYTDVDKLISEMRRPMKYRLLQFTFDIPDGIFDRISVYLKNPISPKEAISASTKHDPMKIANTVQNVLSISGKLETKKKQCVVILCNLGDLVFANRVGELVYKETDVKACHIFTYSNNADKSEFKESELIHRVSRYTDADFHDFALDKLNDMGTTWCKS